MIFKGRGASGCCRVYGAAKRTKFETGFFRSSAQVPMNKSSIEAVACAYRIDHFFVQERALGEQHMVMP